MTDINNMIPFIIQILEIFQVLAFYLIYFIFIFFLMKKCNYFEYLCCYLKHFINYFQHKEKNKFAKNINLFIRNKLKLLNFCQF